VFTTDCGDCGTELLAWTKVGMAGSPCGAGVGGTTGVLVGGGAFAGTGVGGTTAVFVGAGVLAGAGDGGGVVEPDGGTTPPAPTRIRSMLAIWSPALVVIWSVFVPGTTSLNGTGIPAVCHW